MHDVMGLCTFYLNECRKASALLWGAFWTFLSFYLTVAWFHLCRRFLTAGCQVTLLRTIINNPSHTCSLGWSRIHHPAQIGWLRWFSASKIDLLFLIRENVASFLRFLVEPRWLLKSFSVHQISNGVKCDHGWSSKAVRTHTTRCWT